MNELILDLYGLAAVLVPTAVVFATTRTRKQAESKGVRFYPLLILIFAIYIAAVFYFTGPGTLYDLLRQGLELRGEQINLIPFSRAIDANAYLLNILLFVPFGILVPLIWPGKKAMLHTVMSGLLFSASIEICQLFNSRQTDVDDLIMNTLGALTGFLLYKLYRLVVKPSGNVKAHWRFEPGLYLGAMLVGRFLLYNEMGLARVLYNF